MRPAAGILAGMARADVLERVRRYAFLVTMLGAAWLGYLVYAGNITISLDEYRGVPNSAWIGTMAALSSAFFIPLVGFYIVKGSVSRDRTTRVGQILAATPVGTFAYLLAKAASNFVVLASIVAVQLLAAGLMLLLGPESGPIDPAELALPFALITLPPVALIAALAVLFESVRWLRGGVGNILFFFLFTLLMSIPLANGIRELDPTGLGDVEESMHAGARAAYPDFTGGFQLQAAPTALLEARGTPKLFTWDGIDWTPTQVWRRLSWFAAALLLILLAVPFFDRFDETAAVAGPRRAGGALTAPAADGIGEPGSVPDGRRAGARARIARAVPAVPDIGASSRFGRLVGAEIRLTLKGVHPAWHLAAAGLTLACALSPTEAVRGYLLPVAWIWPTLVWSKLGMREEYYGTGQLLFSSPRIRVPQLFAIWCSGVLVAASTGSGALLNFVVAGEWGAVAGLLAGTIFIPSLATACGIWSGGSKLFEALFVTWWYIGPMNRVPDLDFTGGSAGPSGAALYACFALLGLIAAVAGRRRQTAG